jgi:hypothetical protein
MITVSHPHPGTRANITETYVDAWKGLFVGGMENFVLMMLRGEPLGADPSRQKRGPRTSSWMRLRGRLPILLALPRWASWTTVGPYMNELITIRLSTPFAVKFPRTV